MNAYSKELRARLSRIDPVPSGLALDPFTSPRARDLLERVMETTEETSDALTDRPPVRGRWRTQIFVGAATAVVAVAAVLVVSLTSKDVPRQTTGSTLSLSRAPGGTTISSCLPFDVNILRDMPIAFAGTVTEVAADGAVRLHVDHWYKGGTATDVSLAVPGANTSVALDGVDFKTGSRYLVAAAEGTVNGCGFSGEATPELQTAYTQAFGG